MSTCIAYREDGRLCGAPAPILDPGRGGYVCRLHQPDLPAWLSISPAGVLEFDVATFIREAGLADLEETREAVADIAGQVIRQYWPDVPAFIAVKQP